MTARLICLVYLVNNDNTIKTPTSSQTPCPQPPYSLTEYPPRPNSGRTPNAQHSTTKKAQTQTPPREMHPPRGSDRHHRPDSVAQRANIVEHRGLAILWGPNCSTPRAQLWTASWEAPISWQGPGHHCRWILAPGCLIGARNWLYDVIRSWLELPLEEITSLKMRPMGPGIWRV